MARPYCNRCQTSVTLEQDARSCSNCGATIVGAAVANPKPKPQRQIPTANPPIEETQAAQREFAERQSGARGKRRDRATAAIHEGERDVADDTSEE